MKEHLNILLIGSGGREAALAAKLAASPRCARLYCNFPYIPKFSGEAPDTRSSSHEEIAAFCKEQQIDLALIGPEAPIVDGLRDSLEAIPELSEMRIIAPSAEGGRLEGSKEFAKEFMAEVGIPSPRFMSVDAETLQEGLSFLDSLQEPFVLKADGLAEGRGVMVLSDRGEAKDLLEEMIRGLFGEASRKVLIEEYIPGRECSVMIATDGEDYLLLPTARDYKRLEDNDAGPNTRGMGGYSPASLADEDFLRKVEKRIIIPTLRGLKEREIDYQGFLYLGIMELDGEPILIEYNVRLGDPETQIVMPRIDSDFVEILEGIADRTISLKRLDINDKRTVGICLAGEGYPSETGADMPIKGLENAAKTATLCIGPIYRNEEGLEMAPGGHRLLTVVGEGETLALAREQAYEAFRCIELPGGVWRTDIAADAASET